MAVTVRVNGVVVGGPLTSSSPTMTGTATVDVLTATGNVLLGDAAGDTVKTHGTTAAGTQVAATTAAATTGATITTPYGYTTAAQANEIVTKLNLALDALRLHGLIAP